MNEELVGRVVSARVNPGRSVGRHDRALLKFELVLLMIVMVSPLWVMPLSSPVVSDVVVVMHHDSAVSTAVRTITANVPDVRVVEYGSPEYALMIHRVLGRVVWVSHGSDEGVLAGSHVLGWRALGDRVMMTPGKDIVLACGSIVINRYVVGGSAFGFGMIDAILGGLVTSYLLVSSTRDRVAAGSILSKSTGRLAVLLKDPAAPIFLHYTEGSSPPPIPSPPPTWDFYYKGIYWDSYNVDPDHEVIYDHPDYTYYYRTMNVGPSLDFTIDRLTKDSHDTILSGIRAAHISRDTVEFWKAGGVANIIEAIIALGIALGLFTSGVSTVVATVIASIFGAIGVTVSVFVSVFLQDETGSGWVFFDQVRRGEFRMKVGKSWWIHTVSDGCSGIAWLEPSNGIYNYYIRS